MGSTTRDRFDDYGAGPGGPPTEPEQCEMAIENLVLDEVGLCEYFQAQQHVPPEGTPLRLRNELYHGRLALETEDGQIVGLLPTAYNYLLQCMARGYTYAGEVVAATDVPVPVVSTVLGPVA